MELKNREMLNFLNGTAPLATKKMPVKMAFAIKHNRKEMLNKLEPFEEMRHEILEKYPGGKEREEEFGKLLEESVEVDVKKIPIKVVEMTDNEGYDALTLGELEIIDFMLEG